MQALIFDMDGVMVDSEVHWKGVEGILPEVNRPGRQQKTRRGIIGASSYDVYMLLVRDYGLMQTRDEFLALYGKWRKIYTARKSP